MKAIVIKAMSLVILSISCAGALLAGDKVDSAKGTDKTVTYKNQRGSILSLTWNESDESKKAKEGDAPKDTGSLTGTFTSAVGKCAAGNTVPITGYYNGNAIAITLNLPQCKQVIVMTGNLTNDNDEIHTLWLDAAQTADPRKDDWNTNIIGADHYKKKGK